MEGAALEAPLFWRRRARETDSMAVLPTFDPQYQATGRTANQYIAGLDAGASLMDRAQARRLREEENERRRAEEQRQQAEFQAKLPLLQATAKTAVVSAAASVANATKKEELAAKAAETSVDYNERFQNILTIPDVKEKAATLAAFQAEVAWLDNPLLPEYKGFADTVNNSRASAATMELTNLKLEEATEKARIANEALTQRATIAADAGVDRATIAAGSRERVEGTRMIGRVTQESLKGRNAVERSGDSIKHLQDRAAEADQDAADASARGDEQAAAVHRGVASSFRDGVQKATTFAGQAPLEVPGKSPTGGRKEKPPVVESPAPGITLGGVDYGKEAPAAAAPTAAPGKLYVAAEGKPPELAPTVKTPQQILQAVQQMVDDGVMDADEARATLTKMGFRPKR